MTTNYTITKNHTYDSHEVTFDAKPAKTVLDALKKIGMRWNHKKGCWYGFAEEHEIISAILDNGTGETITGEETTPTVYTDGYLGGGAVYGAKSQQHLYGSDLSKAIRQDIKAAGINGVTVRCKSYSGGQSITATITFTPDDLTPAAEYLANYHITDSSAWIYTGSESIHRDTYFAASADEQHAIRYAAAKYEYTKAATTTQDIYRYHPDKYTEFNHAFLSKVSRINSIIGAYRYDESNSMVDYFHTNFYYTLCTKPANPTQPDFPPELADLYN